MTKPPRFTYRKTPPDKQQGATLIVGMIMIVLITLIVVNAFTVSSSNLKSVTNLQMREQALAAGNEALELVISSAFTDSPVEQSIDVDIDKDGKVDYTVTVYTPTCVRAATVSTAAPSDVELGPGMSAGSTWNTDWDLDATVKDPVSGASVRVRQGVRVLLSDAKKMAVCA